MLTNICRLCLIVFVLAACDSNKTEESSTLSREVNEYPGLVLRLENGDQLSAKNLTGKNVFVLFQPDCSHCQEEAIHIEQRLDAFKDYQLYFISSSGMEEIMAFARNFKLDSKKNVKFAWTSPEGVLTYYGPIATPSIYIYSNGRLRRSFNGQTDIENIIKAL